MTLWKYQAREWGVEFRGQLWAMYEIEGTPVSDDYTSEEISAVDLFGIWEEFIRGVNYRDGLVPIRWYVRPEPEGLPSFMPFVNDGLADGQKTFLDHFTWPTNVETGEPLNWLALPVRDQFWSKEPRGKGGFIQEATGWKPSLLQPFLRLSSLVEGFGSYQGMLLRVPGD